MNTSSKISKKLPEIPEDITIEILSWLPVKSLLRFRLVCKTWYNVIKSPSFISMHHNSGTESQLLIWTNNVDHKRGKYDHVLSLRSNDKHTRVLSPDFKIPETPGYKVCADSCNGIVCSFDFTGLICLTNFATREFKKLPPTSIKSTDNLSQFGVGFVSDSSNISDFKVLRVHRTFTEYLKSYRKTMRSELFTLSSNTWRQVERGLDKDLQIDEFIGLFCANSFHFLASSNFKFTILCFDIHTEKLTTMDLPSKADRVGVAKSLTVVKELLSVVCIDYGNRDEYGSVEIWNMKDYGVVESWTKLFSIVPPSRIARAICFQMGDHTVLLVQDTRNKLATCDLNTLSFESINIDGFTPRSQVVVHKESLVSIM